MDDQFLHDQRREPGSGFARSLRAKLRRIEDEQQQRSPASRWAPFFATAAAAAFVIAAFTVPAVRATAQAALDLFRVQEFAVVQVDEARIERLKNIKVDMSSLVGGKVETLQAELPPQRFATLDAADAFLGVALAHPTVLPRNMAAESVFVKGESRTRMTVDTRPVRELLQALDLRDVNVPEGLDGKQLVVHMPIVVSQAFRSSGRHRAMFVQGESPQVELPPGLALEQFGEVGLRLLGLSAGEAHRLAGSIDWRSTLVVPVIAGASSYQQVRVQGQRGLLLEMDETSGEDAGRVGSGHRRAVLWSRNGRVMGLMGNLERGELMTMAESVR